MSWDTWACHGYTVEITEGSIRKLNIDVADLEKDIAESKNNEDSSDGLDVELDLVELFIDTYGYEDVVAEVNGKKIDVNVYTHNEGSGPDDLEDEVSYFIFSKEDLYLEIPTTITEHLEDIGLTPEESFWTQSG